MKKLCVLLLCLLLLLCACQKQTTTTEHETLLITDGQPENPTTWSGFYRDAFMGKPCQIKIRHQQDGAVIDVALSFDGNIYTVTEDGRTRTYKHLIHSPMQGPANAAYDYADIFLLSDDPDMTAECYLQAALSSSTLMQELAPTQIIYADYFSFPRAEVYDAVPAEISRIMDSFSPSDRVIWSKKAYYVLTQQVACSVRTATIIDRYDYEGNLLCQASIKGTVGTILELDNGGFVAESTSYADELSLLVCCNPDGSVRWQHTFGDGSYYFSCLHQKGDSIYAFGQFEPDPKHAYTDILICRFSMDGQLIQQKQLGGSNFESIDRVLETSNGFTILGDSQSNDGAFPLSKDGYPVSFSADISLALEMSNIQLSDHDYESLLGYHNDLPVYSDDPIFDAHNTDRLPTERGPYNAFPYSKRDFFDFEDGYVIIRVHLFEYYYYSPYMTSYIPSYRELIITGYDNSGNALWQTTSDIYIS